MTAPDETARDLLVSAARECGFRVPDVTTVEEFELACMAVLEGVKGGQDHGHARNGIRSAIEAAREGNAEYTRAGLWEAKKVLDLVHYDRQIARME